MTHPLSTDRLREIVAGTATWQCETGPAGVLWYLRLDTAAKPPYRNQRHVEAILDIAADGTLAGVELIDNMPAAPLALRASKPEEEKLIEVARDKAVDALRDLEIKFAVPDGVSMRQATVAEAQRLVRAALASLEGNRDER